MLFFATAPNLITMTKLKQDTCKLCTAIVDSLENGINSKIENRLLFSTESFVVTPCISPLEPGHILITSKKHYQNLSLMDSKSFDEIQEIINHLAEKLPGFYSNYLIAEHGAYDFEQNSGACIIHTHLHVIPNSGNSLSGFDKILKFKKLDSLYQIKEIDFPYILAATNEIIKVYNADNVPSQMIRRLVLASKGEIENWDWRLKTNESFNEMTIKKWNNVE